MKMSKEELMQLLVDGKNIEHAKKIAADLRPIIISGDIVQIPAKAIKSFCSKLDFKPAQKRSAITPLQGWTDECVGYTGKSRARGYGNVNWSDGGKTRSIRAHRLAYMIGFGSIPRGHLVRHKCHQPLCVAPWCLCSGTSQDNSDDMVKSGRSLDQSGSKNHNAKLSESDRWWALYRHEDGESYESIGESMGVHLSTIHKVCQERRKLLESQLIDSLYRFPASAIREILAYGVEFGSDPKNGQYPKPEAAGLAGLSGSFTYTGLSRDEEVDRLVDENDDLREAIFIFQLAAKRILPDVMHMAGVEAQRDFDE